MYESDCVNVIRAWKCQIFVEGVGEGIFGSLYMCVGICV